MNFALIPSASKFPNFSSPIIKKTLHPSKIVKRFVFRRSRIVSLSSTSPDSIPTISTPDSQNPNFSNDPLASPNGKPLSKFVQSAESSIERIIFDFRFLALLAIGGSLAGSVICFMNGCVYVFDAYKIYWTSCLKGVHSGQMVLRLVEAIDIYLAGTVMLVFAMGLYGLFITNTSANVNPSDDRAIKGSSLFGMFALKRMRSGYAFDQCVPTSSLMILQCKELRILLSESRTSVSCLEL
ncbi:uncharacterized protein LOC104907628 isoform X2 [Beta vulgaris subsp. vulgaris]|uniref:uncharacterized protein LOC104907628 isoform X2 n=1 Tax=Beta vulgaris subsp. vulgaris TaxID=3555 RepID=UPI0020374A39|nr:uncharacterized protein LOC104907628 isoform X2 [Beta vulgaris subsp. vulgaris]